MTSQPRVSIITPSYNRAFILPRAIESVLNQSFSNFDLIIIDDGSTDNTEKIVKQYCKQDKRIQYIKIKHSGAAQARNTGIKHSTGEIIAYLDSDNLWYQNYLSVMTSELTKEYILVYSAQNIILQESNELDSKILARSIRRNEYNPIWILSGNYIDPNALIHRRNIFKKVGLWDSTIKEMNDWEFNSRVIKIYPFQIKFIDQVLGEYYYCLKNNANITNTYMSKDSIIRKFRLKSTSKPVRLMQERVHRLIFK